MKRCNNCFSEHDVKYDVCPHCGYYKGQPAKELYHLFPEMILADRYMIGEVLGFGGFGITYKAWDSKLETVVAIKEYYPSGLVNRIPGSKDVILFTGSKAKEYRYGLERFLDEAKNMAKFNSHPNIVNVFEYFEENNTAYIVMEYLDGVSLSGFLKDNVLDVQSSVELICDVCTALKEIHSHGIIHRDVSPDNIFVCYNGSVKLIDFGAARFSANEEKKQMTVIIKPGYAPPEQYEQISAQGPWTDIYALGATLYRMLTGEKPEESTSRKNRDTLLPPHEIKPEIDENMSNTVMKAMALDRQLRFDKVETFEKALAGKKKVVTVAKEKKRRRRRRVYGIVAAMLALIVAFGAVGFNFLKQREEQTLPDASIALWYMMSGDSDTDQAKNRALTLVIASFTDSYPNVSVELIGVAKEDYLNTIAAAATQASEFGYTLGLFESTIVTADQIQDFACVLSSDITKENIGDCYFLDRYDACYPERTQLPLGFEAPVIYCNTAIATLEAYSVASIDELLVQAGQSKGVAVHENVKDAVAAAFGEDIFLSSQVTVVTGSDDFVAGDYAFYIASSTEFLDIQSRLPARYTMAAMGSDVVRGKFADVYSVCNTLTKDEQKVAFALLSFMYSDNAQDYLYIQNWSGHLPLNRSALTIVQDVYSDFDGFFDNLSSYSFG